MLAHLKINCFGEGRPSLTTYLIFVTCQKSRKNAKMSVLSQVYYVLAQIYALLGENFSSLKMCGCNKNDKYQVCLTQLTQFLQLDKREPCISIIGRFRHRDQASCEKKSKAYALLECLLVSNCTEKTQKVNSFENLKMGNDDGDEDE